MESIFIVHVLMASFRHREHEQSKKGLHVDNTFQRSRDPER